MAREGRRLKLQARKSEGEERREEESSGVHDLEAQVEESLKAFFFFLIKDAQCVNSVPAPYLCYGTHTYSNPMTNAADNSITEDFNRGYLGDSQRAKVA